MDVYLIIITLASISIINQGNNNLKMDQTIDERRGRKECVINSTIELSKKKTGLNRTVSERINGNDI